MPDRDPQDLQYMARLMWIARGREPDRTEFAVITLARAECMLDWMAAHGVKMTRKPTDLVEGVIVRWHDAAPMTPRDET